MTGQVKRSLSTPNVQQAVAAAAAAAMAEPPYSTDKRRNKLGYHRTSVACGHCRRRKIRCLLAKDDAQGRCSNCIRLKKECTFYPVDATDRRPRSMSKPDISSQEPASAASSPSPGHGGQLPLATEPPRGYPASVPVTPTYDFVGSFEDSFRNHNHILNSGGRSLPISRSTNIPHKSSLAQMQTVPLGLKVEPGYLAPRDGFRPHWDLSSQSENPIPIPDQFRPLEDPSASFWRLTSSGIPASPYVSPLQNVDPMVSTFASVDSADLQDDSAWHSQVSSRIGSIDQGMVPAYALGSYSSEADFIGLPPGLVSASASTASLTASISEASQYGGGGGDGRAPAPYFIGPWASDPMGESGLYKLESPLEAESFDQGLSFYMDEERPYPLTSQSPLHGTAPVEMSHA